MAKKTKFFLEEILNLVTIPQKAHVNFEFSYNQSSKPTLIFLQNSEESKKF
jgi:hypothetical protein